MAQKPKIPSSDKTEEVGHCIRRCLNTVDGQLLLNFLHEEYNRDNMRGPDVVDTYFNLGQRDVVMLLQTISESTPK